MANLINVVDKAPKFRFAVVSTRKENGARLELESSFGEEHTARGLFERQYSNWGLVDTNFYLVDWEKQSFITSHVTYQDEFTNALRP